MEISLQHEPRMSWIIDRSQKVPASAPLRYSLNPQAKVREIAAAGQLSAGGGGRVCQLAFKLDNGFSQAR
jgi:hypothetical protein